MRRAWLVFAATAGLAAEPTARADVPPPPGRTRVAYRYRLDQPVEGRAIVAFPTYTGSDSRAQVMEAGKDYGIFQGDQPGIYSLDRAEVGALPTKYEELKAFLEARAVVCLKQVPRVFEVPTSDGFNEVTDVVRVAMVDGKCRTQLASTIYRGNGKAAQGGVFANGKRAVPAPFRDDVPPVTESGFDLSAAPAGPMGALPAQGQPPASAEPHGAGCAGCAAAGRSPARPAWVAVAAGVLGALRRPRRRAVEGKPAPKAPGA